MEEHAENGSDNTQNKIESKGIMKFIERLCPRREMPYSRLNTNTSNHIQIPNPSAEIQLQSLDANTLLLHHDKSVNYNPGASPSPSGSSLDLEWECEYGNGNQAGGGNHQSWLPIPGNAAGDTTIDEMSSCDDDGGLSSGHSKPNTPTQKRKSNKESNNLHKSLLQFKSIGPGQNIRAMSKTSGSHISTPDSLEWDVHEEEQTYKSETEDSLDIQTLELLQEIEWLKNRTLDETSPKEPGTTILDS